MTKQNRRPGRPAKVITDKFKNEVYKSDAYLDARVEDYLRSLVAALRKEDINNLSNSKARDIKLTAFILGSVKLAPKALDIINSNKELRGLFDSLTDPKVSPLLKFANEKGLANVLKLFLTEGKDPNTPKAVRRSEKKEFLYKELSQMKKNNSGKLPPHYEKIVNQKIEAKFGAGSAYQHGSIPRMLSRDRNKSNK